MSDIDFDELDKAVASVLEGEEPASQKSESPSPTIPPVENTSLSTSESNAPSPPISHHGVNTRMTPGRSTIHDAQLTHQATEVTPAERPQPSAQPPVSPSLAARRSGRFMDIVHPSADMQRRGEARAALRRKRETVVQPVATPTLEQPPAPASDPTPQPIVDESAPLPLPTPQAAGASDDTAQEFQSHNHELEKAIDELFVSEGHAPVGSSVAPEVPSEKVAESTSEVGVTETTAVSSQENHLPEPTRLSDVVGIETSNQSEDTPTDQTAESTSLIQDSATESAEQNSEESKEKADISQLATEFESTPRVIDTPQTTPFLKDTKVEKRPLGGTPSSIQEDTTPAKPTESPYEPNKKEESSTEDLPEELHNDLVAIESGNAAKSSDEAPAIEKKPTPVSSAASATTPVVTSIPRQYKETTQQLDEEESSVFDTNTYHQPLEAAPKKKANKAWIAFFVVVLLIVLGVAAAFAWLSGLLVVPF